MTFNPYDAPLPIQETGGDSDCWREGKVLVMRQGTHIPLRCIKCNKKVPFRGKERTVYWHHPGLYLLILLQFLIYLIAALIVRKKASIDPSLCATHTQRRSVAIWSAWSMVGLSIIGFVALASRTDDAGGLFVIPVTLLLVAIFVAIFGTRLLSAKRINDDEVRLNGCGEEFLQSLPVKRGF